jgi:hypothetical protein
MESILKQYYPDMDMVQFEREMTGIDDEFKYARRDVVFSDMYDEEEPLCYEDCDEDTQDYYNKQTAIRLMSDFLRTIDELKYAKVRAGLADNVDFTDEDILGYNLLVCYLLKCGHLKSDLDVVQYRTLFMWDVWCLYQPQNVASYLETVQTDDLWNLHYSRSLYCYLALNYLAWEEIMERIRFRYLPIKE